MDLDKKVEQLLTDFPKLYGLHCNECDDDIEYVQQIRDEFGEYNFRYEYACNGCGLIYFYRDLMGELKQKWPYNIIMNWKK